MVDILLLVRLSSVLFQGRSSNVHLSWTLVKAERVFHIEQQQQGRLQKAGYGD
jgi:hypothetical protein